MKKEYYSFLLLLIPILYFTLCTASSYLVFPFIMLPASAQLENNNSTDNGEKGFLYVGNAKSSSISVIDLATNKAIKNIPVGSGTHDIRISEDQQVVYTTDIDSGTISTVNATENTLIDQINTGVAVHGIAGVNDTLYVGDVYGGKVLVIKDNIIKDEIKVGSGPEYIEARPPDGRILYVANLWSPISVVDLEENKVIKNPDYVKLSPDERFAYVTNLGEDTVSKIDLRNLDIIKSKIPVGRGPHGIAFSADGDLAYISNKNGNDISIIDTFTDTVVATITSGGIEPHQIVAKKPTIKLTPAQSNSPAKTVFIEIADDTPEQERGLMFRKSLGPNSGMLFVYDDLAYRSFTMKNTFIPLDMIFLDNDLKIIDIKKDVQPCLQEDPCPSYPSAWPAKYVLEVNAGFTDQNSIQVGDGLEI